MNPSDQWTALLAESNKKRDNLIFEFSRIDHQLRKLKTEQPLPASNPYLTVYWLRKS